MRRRENIQAEEAGREDDVAELFAARRVPVRAPYLNRELSQLEFIGRVVSVAEDPTQPLLERLKFLAISGQNLDHFFQVRVGGLQTQIETRMDARSPDGMSPTEQLEAIRPHVLSLTQRQADVLAKDLLPQLAEAGIVIDAWEDLDAESRDALSRHFQDQIFPVLTPISVDPAHPFPYISNLSLNLALAVVDHTAGQHRFARVKIPALLPRFLACNEPGHFVPVEQVVAAHTDLLFPGTEILSCHPFRITRDADLAIEQSDADDLLLAVASALQRRLRMNAAVRLEAPSAMSEQLREILASELELEPLDVYCLQAPLDLGAFWSLYSFDRPDLKYPDFSPVTPRELSPAGDGTPCDFFAELRDRDLLVHHPYESFSSTVEAFLAQAAIDEDVLAIKHTLYRTSRPGNRIMGSLIQAAAAGKEVVSLVELTARFDEAANIEWARALEEAGVHVVYGMVGLKAHGKTTLVVRREADGIRRYGHIGTGNYNPDTARAYEDFGLFTSDPILCADLGQFFNYLTANGRQQRFDKLWVAPSTLRSTLLELIHREMKADGGRIVMKANALADPQIIDALYAASQAGVEIDLIIRGVCRLRPGVRGLSERIRVRSLVGRFLEHSRVFRFGSGARAVYAIGSADLMARNLDRRVEVVTPVEDPMLTARLAQMLQFLLEDDVLAWELDAAGAWHRVSTQRDSNAQQELLLSAARRSDQLDD